MSSFGKAPAPSRGGFWSIERVVALLTPAFSVAAGALSTGIGSAVGIPKADFVALFTGGLVAGASAALKWLHGRQKFVNFIDDADKVADGVVAKIQANPAGGLALADIEGILKAHTAQIIDAIGKTVHAPPSVEDVAKQIIASAAGASKPAGAAEQGAAVTGQ